MSALAAARAHVRTIGFVSRLLPMFPSAPIDWLTRAPVIESVTYQTRDGEVRAEVYRPPGRGPYPAVLMCLGVVPFGVDHPQIPRLKAALARFGFVALIHWSPAMRDRRLVPEDIENTAAAYDYLVRRPDVNPATSGLFGTCVGGSFALLAAAHPSIRDRVAFVGAFAPYSSMWTFVRDIASRTRSNGGSAESWLVDPLTRDVFVRSVTDTLAPHEAERLRADGSTDGEIDPAELSGDGRAVYALLTARDRDAAELALQALPQAMRRRLDAMSPLQHIGDIKAGLILVGHDRDDLVIPVGESRRLASALRARAGAKYTEYAMFQHADPTKRKLSPLRLIRELRRFYLSLYPMFRQAVVHRVPEGELRSATGRLGLRHMVRREEPLDGVHLPVGVHDADVRVPSGASIELGKDPEEVRQQDAVHAAVADDEDGLSGALAGEAIDHAERPREDLIERLSARPRDETVVVPVR